MIFSQNVSSTCLVENKMCLEKCVVHLVTRTERKHRYTSCPFWGGVQSHPSIVTLARPRVCVPRARASTRTRTLTLAHMHCMWWTQWVLQLLFKNRSKLPPQQQLWLSRTRWLHRAAPTAARSCYVHSFHSRKINIHNVKIHRSTETISYSNQTHVRLSADDDALTR